MFGTFCDNRKRLSEGKHAFLLVVLVVTHNQKIQVGFPVPSYKYFCETQEE
jgi:hypothetical protein